MCVCVCVFMCVCVCLNMTGQLLCNGDCNNSFNISIGVYVPHLGQLVLHTGSIPHCARPSERASRTYRDPPPSPFPFPWQGTYHYVPKMYLRVSKTQSHLFPQQPLGCILCGRIPLGVQPVADQVQPTNISFKSHMQYCFVKQWAKCS